MSNLFRESADESAARASGHPDAAVRLPKTAITVIVLFLGVFALYYVTAPRDVWSGDSIFYAMTARQLAINGSVDLSDQIELVDPSADLAGSWLTKGPGGLLSHYPPGTALLAAPFFALAPESPGVLTIVNVGNTNSEITIEVPPLTPATIVSAASTAAAVLAIFLLISHLGATRREAVIAALVFALATGAWSVASQRLWSHGPAMMWLTLGIYLRETSRKGFAGLADVAAVVTRPPTAVIGGTRTLVKAIRTRQVRPAVLDFGWLLLGVAIVAIYNVAVVGSDPFLGGYATVDDIQITRPNLGFWVTNLASALADPQRGVLTISPFILYLLLGVRKGWRSSAPWVRDAALGGLAYFLLHNLTHDFRGGDGYFGYRYPLEAVAVAAPLLFCSYQSWVKGHRFRVVVLGISVAVSVLLQAYGLANQFG